MTAVLLVLLVGAGIGSLGLLLPDFYVVGIIVITIGGIGLLVRAADVFVRTRR